MAKYDIHLKLGNLSEAAKAQKHSLSQNMNFINCKSSKYENKTCKQTDTGTRN